MAEGRTGTGALPLKSAPANLPACQLLFEGGVFSAVVPWGQHQGAGMVVGGGLQPGVQEAWSLYPEPWLALENQGSTRDPHPWMQE